MGEASPGFRPFSSQAFGSTALHSKLQPQRAPAALASSLLSSSSFRAVAARKRASLPRLGDAAFLVHFFSRQGQSQAPGFQTPGHGDPGGKVNAQHIHSAANASTSAGARALSSGCVSMRSWRPASCSSAMETAVWSFTSLQMSALYSIRCRATFRWPLVRA